MKELEKWAQFALESAQGKVPYLEVRTLEQKEERLVRANGQNQARTWQRGRGLAVRIWDRGWGFAATGDLSPAGIKEALSLAKIIARNPKAQLAPGSEAKDRWQGPCQIDPFALPLTTKLALLKETESQLRQEKIVASSAGFIFEREEQYYLNSLGAEIRQTKTTSGFELRVVATDGTQTITCTDPNCLGGGFLLAGFEFLDEANLPQRARGLAKQANLLLKAPAAPRGKLDLILGGNQLALQLHETFGHALELDRALGTEESLAGGSFLTPESLGVPVASELINITADSTLEGAGGFGYDAEGTPGQSIPLIRAGIPVGFLGSREHNLEGVSPGAMRFGTCLDLPLIRMTNVNLEPGKESLVDLISGIERGLLIETPNAWSIDQNREHFQFGAESGYLIERGKLQGLVQNPTYKGAAVDFWSRCDGVSDRAQWQTVPNCGKGLPVQVIKIGHKVPEARFREIDVSYGGRL